MIKGYFSAYTVWIDGTPLTTSRSRRLHNYAPDGLVSWGYHGNGPSQLALSLLLHFGASDQEALQWHQDFKREVIAELPEADFEMPNSRIIDWIEAKRLIRQLENN